MAGCVKNIPTKNYQYFITGFQVTVENVRDAFLGHSVELTRMTEFVAHHQPHRKCSVTATGQLSVQNQP